MNLPAILAISALLCSTNLFAATLPPGFEETAVSGTITTGTAIAFAPGGKLYVLEQAGIMKVYQSSANLAAEWTQVAPSSDFFTGNELAVSAIGERGLLGVTFDPNFASNRFLYVYYTASVPIHNRLSRFTANLTGTQVVPGSETVLMDFDNVGLSWVHNGGAMHFGLDGKLYLAVGDKYVIDTAPRRRVLPRYRLNQPCYRR